MNFVQSIAELPNTGLEASLTLLDVFQTLVLHRLDDIRLRCRIKIFGFDDVERGRFEGRILSGKLNVDVYPSVTYGGNVNAM